MTTDTPDLAEEARRESRVRHRLARQGLSVRKDRARSWSAHHHGGYMLVDASTNALVGGPRFDLTLDDLEKWAEDGAADSAGGPGMSTSDTEERSQLEIAIDNLWAERGQVVNRILVSISRPGPLSDDAWTGWGRELREIDVRLAELETQLPAGYGDTDPVAAGAALT